MEKFPLVLKIKRPKFYTMAFFKNSIFFLRQLYTKSQTKSWINISSENYFDRRRHPNSCSLSYLDNYSFLQLLHFQIQQSEELLSELSSLQGPNDVLLKYSCFSGNPYRSFGEVQLDTCLAKPTLNVQYMDTIQSSLMDITLKLEA